MMKYRFFSTFVLILLSTQNLSLAEVSTHKLEKAHAFFESTLFEEAVPLYLEILEEKEGALDESLILLRIAQAQYLNGQYAQAISTILKNPLEEHQPEASYILGLSFKKLEQSEPAIAAFKRYLEAESKEKLPYHHATHYELGLAYLRNGIFSLSRKHFEEVLENSTDLNLSAKAKLSLAKIEKFEERPQVAETILQQLDETLDAKDPLRYELSFQQGEIAYLLGNYSQSAIYFQQAIPKNKSVDAPWSSEAWYRLAWCHLQLENFDLGESILKDLIINSRNSRDERFLLALGQLYLSKGKSLKDSTALAQVEELLGQAELFAHADNRACALFLRAEAAVNEAEKDSLYKLLTQEIYEGTEWYAHGWYQRGLHEYEKANQFLAMGSLAEAKQLLTCATTSLHKAFNLLHNTHSDLAEKVVQILLDAYCKEKTQDSYFAAYRFLDRLIKEEKKFFDSLKNPEELYYKRGLIASYLRENDHGNTFYSLSTNALQEGLTRFPHGPYADKSFFLLGTLHYHEKAFSEAERAFLAAEISPETLFFAAQCAESDPLGNERARQYREMLFERFPTSPYAAEAWFFYYPFKEYLQGEGTSLKHLQEMKEKFPDSPFTIAALYLLGMNCKKDRKSFDEKWPSKKNLNSAIEFFEAAESTFDNLYLKKAFQHEDLPYFIKIRYQSLLERALTNMAIADDSQGAKKQIFLEYAAEVLETITYDFKNKEHPLASTLCNKAPYPHILEESSYWLSQVFIKLQDDKKAEVILEEMLEKYKLAKITRGYILSRVWYELSQICMRRQDYSNALKFLAAAEDSAKGKLLSPDQKIDLWISQGLCHKEKGEMDKAMILLSKAINDDAISSLRIKAMFIRAEIYAIQGRNDLARKQLEATSKKGGEWALKAKQKLDMEYGYQ